MQTHWPSWTTEGLESPSLWDVQVGSVETSGPFLDVYLYQTWTSTNSLVWNHVCSTSKSSSGISLCLEACTIMNANIWQLEMEGVGGIIRSLCCNFMKIHMQEGRILEGQTGTIVNIWLLKKQRFSFPNVGSWWLHESYAVTAAFSGALYWITQVAPFTPGASLLQLCPRALWDPQRKILWNFCSSISW